MFLLTSILAHIFHTYEVTNTLINYHFYNYIIKHFARKVVSLACNNIPLNKDFVDGSKYISILKSFLLHQLAQLGRVKNNSKT